MNKFADCLVEIQTGELPPTSLLQLAQAFAKGVGISLTKSRLTFEAIRYFVTPRRLAILIEKLAATQLTQEIERKGPPLKDAFDREGKPSKACLGFARSYGISPKKPRQ